MAMKGNKGKEKAEESKLGPEEMSTLPPSDSTECLKDNTSGTDSPSPAMTTDTQEQEIATASNSNPPISPSGEKPRIPARRLAALAIVSKQDKMPDSGIHYEGRVDTPVTAIPTSVEDPSLADRERLSPLPLSIRKMTTSNTAPSMHSHNNDIPVVALLRVKTNSPGTGSTPISLRGSAAPFEPPSPTTINSLGNDQNLILSQSPLRPSPGAIPGYLVGSSLPRQIVQSPKTIIPQELLESSHHQQESQTIPSASNTPHYSRPDLKFIEEPSNPFVLWEGDNHPIGLHMVDPSRPRSNAHVLGDTPPTRGSPTQSELDDEKWLESFRAEAEVEARENGQSEAADKTKRLDALLGTAMRACADTIPQEIQDWKIFVNDQSKGSKEEATVGTTIDLGNKAVEAAFSLGTLQTSEIITLRHEKKELERTIESIKEEGGVGGGYIPPQKLWEQQKRWDKEIDIRDSQIRTMTDRLAFEKMDITKELVVALALNEKLTTELDKYVTRYRDVEAVNSSQTKDQFDKFQSTLFTEEENCKNLRDDLTNKRKNTELLEGKLRNEMPDIKELRRDIEEVQSHLDASRGQTTSKHPNNPGRSEANKDDDEGGQASPEVKDDAVDIGILRIKVQLYTMIQERAQHGMRKDDASVAAVQVAQEILNLSTRIGDDTATARVSFWLGVALYYNDDLHAARIKFNEACGHMCLPAYEASIIEGWIERCLEVGPEQDAAEYGGIARSRRTPQNRVAARASRAEPQTETQETPLEAPEAPAENAANQDDGTEDTMRRFLPARWLRSLRDAF